MPNARDRNPTASTREWLSAAAAVLRRSGRMTTDDPDERVWEVLGRKTVEGLPVTPLGIREHTSERPGEGTPGQPPFTRGTRTETRSGWDIRSYLADPVATSAATAAVTDLEGGANSVWLRVGGGGTALTDLPSVLGDVQLDLAPVVLEASLDTNFLDAAAHFAGILNRRGIQPHPDSNIAADPIGRFVRSGRPAPDAPLDFTKAVQRSAVQAHDLGIRALVVEGTVAHERGAGDAAELGYCLAAGASYLRTVSDLNYDADATLRLFEFRYAATDDQFATIAKFRAARLLWDRVLELSGLSEGRPGQSQHAATSRPMMTRYDAWTNLLRTTVAAFAAGVAGAQAITVQPFDSALGIPDALGRRMACNISHILTAESHVAAAADPAGGAFGVESLTWELAEAGWAEFRRIEKGGSILRAIADGSLRQHWDDTAARRDQQINTRRQPITGVSEFPLPREVLPVRRASTFPGEPTTERWAHRYEDFRDNPPHETVFLATLGAAADYGPRATFATNAFAAGGFEVAAAGALDIDGLPDAYLAAGRPPIVCLAGSDADYADRGAQAAELLRAAGARRIILAGHPSGDIAGVLDDYLTAGGDLVAFLSRTRQALGLPEPGSSGESA